MSRCYSCFIQCCSAQHLAKLWGKVAWRKRPVHRPLSYWKIKKLAWDLTYMAGRNCCNSITLRLILLTNLESIDKYQTGVISTTCDSPTAISDWTLIVCDVFLLGWWICVQSVILRVFRRGHCKCIFFSEQNDANSSRWIFLSNCSEWLSHA